MTRDHFTPASGQAPLPPGEGFGAREEDAVPDETAPPPETLRMSGYHY